MKKDYKSKCFVKGIFICFEAVALFLLLLLISIAVIIQDFVFYTMAIGLPLLLMLIVYFLTFSVVVFKEHHVFVMTPTKWRNVFYGDLKFCYIAFSKEYLGSTGNLGSYKRTKTGTDTTCGKKTEWVPILSILFAKSVIDGVYAENARYNNKEIKHLGKAEYIIDMPFLPEYYHAIFSKIQCQIITNKFIYNNYKNEINEFLTNFHLGLTILEK